MSHHPARSLCGGRQWKDARARRRLLAIHFYEGKNGSSKSAHMVLDTLPELEAGCLTLSTVRLLDYENPRPCDDDECDDVMHGRADHMAAHPLYVPFRTWEHLQLWADPTITVVEYIKRFLSHSKLAVERALARVVRFGAALMDEITGVADTDAGAEIPPALKNKFAQLRRDDIPIRMSGISFGRAHKRLRQACSGLTVCSGKLGVQSRTPDGMDRLYPMNRLGRAVTYDAESLPVDDISKAAYKNARVICRSRIWIPDSPAIGAYDTFAPVMSVGTVTEAGRCAKCGGRRPAPECSCADYLAGKEARKLAGPQGRSPRTAERRALVAAGSGREPGGGCDCG
jgi:hypothetical protein